MASTEWIVQCGSAPAQRGLHRASAATSPFHDGGDDLTTAISIGLFGGGLCDQLANHSQKDLTSTGSRARCFLTNDVSATTRRATVTSAGAGEKIEGRKDVKSVRFLNRDDAYNDAIKEVPQFLQRTSRVRTQIPASFIVKLNNPEQHKDFDAAMVPANQGAQRAQPEGLIDRLFAVLDALSIAAFAVAVVPAVGAILLIANMVQVAAYTRRTGASCGWWAPPLVRSCRSFWRRWPRPSCVVIAIMA